MNVQANLSRLARYRERLEGWIIELEKRLPESTALLRSPRQLYKLITAITSVSFLLLSDFAVSLLTGEFSSGKTTALMPFLPEPLPSGEKPVTRLFTVISPTPGLKRAEYVLMRLGQNEARQILRLMCEFFPEPLQKEARDALGQSDVEASARAVYDCILTHFDDFDNEDVRKRLDEAAFLARSIASHLGKNFSMTPMPLSGLEQAGLYVSWGKLRYQSGGKPNAAALQEALDGAFDGTYLKAHPHVSPAEQARFKIGLELACLGYLEVRIPANDTLVSGSVWCDSPGTGNDFHDLLKARLVLRSAASGVVVVNLQRPQGNDSTVLTHELQKKLPKAYPHAIGGLFTHADVIVKNLARSGVLCTDFHKNLSQVREVISHFADLMEFKGDNTEAKIWMRLLDAKDPHLASHLVLSFALFDPLGLDDDTRRCQMLLPLRTWLESEPRRALLPPHIQELLTRITKVHGPAEPEPFPLEQLWPGQSERATARLLGLLVSLAHDGSMGSVKHLFAQVRRDIEDIRKAQIQEHLAAAEELLSVLELPTATSQTKPGLCFEDQERLEELSLYLTGHIARGKKILSPRLHLDEVMKAIDLFVVQTLERLLQRTQDELVVPKSSQRALAKAAFGKLLSWIESRLRLPMDRAMQAASERIVEEFDTHLEAGLTKTSQLPSLSSGPSLETLQEHSFPVAHKKHLMSQLQRDLLGGFQAAFEEEIQCNWTQAWTVGSPMDSLPVTCWSGDQSEQRMIQITRRVVAQRLIQIGLATSQTGAATAHQQLETTLEHLCRMFDSSKLQHIALEQLSTIERSPEEQRALEAQELLLDIQRELPALLDGLIQELSQETHEQTT